MFWDDPHFASPGLSAASSVQLLKPPILDPNLQKVLGRFILFSLVDPRHELQLVLQVLVALTPIVDFTQRLDSGQQMALLSLLPETADQASLQR
jgi:hypothetical protein